LSLFVLFVALVALSVENRLQRLDFIRHEALLIKVMMWATFGCAMGTFEG
jgi:hypothetical protein